MKNVGICGHFGGNKNFLDGQTVKTKIVTKELEKEFGDDEVKKVDTFGGKRRLVPILLNLISLVVSCKNIIILPAHNSLRIFAPLLAFMNNFYHRKLHYVVIGGWLPKFVATRKWLKNALMKFTFIYVETRTMKNQLEAMGFTNIVLLPNCKDLNVIRLEELVYTKQEPFKLCTFSRVMKEKGIEDAINAVKAVNDKVGKNVYTLDIYGQVDKEQTDWFANLQTKFPDYVKYKGLVPFDKTTEVLKDYFLLLFPTKFYTEGIPGTIIDAYAAGLPVISSRWESFSDVVEDDITGIGYEFGSDEALIETLEMIEHNPQIVINMKEACLRKSKSYLPKFVVGRFIEKFF